MAKALIPWPVWGWAGIAWMGEGRAAHSDTIRNQSRQHFHVSAQPRDYFIPTEKKVIFFLPRVIRGNVQFLSCVNTAQIKNKASCSGLKLFCSVHPPLSSSFAAAWPGAAEVSHGNLGLQGVQGGSCHGHKPWE